MSVEPIPPADTDVSTVKSAERTARILEVLALSPTRLTFSELHELTGYPRSSLHGLVRTLRDINWVETDEDGSAIGVGPRALLVGTAYLDRDPVLPYAREALEDLREELGYTLHYARRIDADVLYLASRDARNTNRAVSRIGRTLPLYVTALGHALLAELSDDEADALLPSGLEAHTKNTVVKRDVLLTGLDAVRAKGWAFESEQNTIGIACVAVTIGYRLPATDAISCSMPAGYATPSERTRISRALLKRSKELADTLRRNGIR